MKNLRNSQKWLSLISQNQTKLPQVLNKLTPNIINLSLRNIVLGKNHTNIQIILNCCPHLIYLDIGKFIY
jgi:hypothetical protein